MLMLIFQHFQLKALTLIASININNVSVNSIIVNGNFEPASVNVNVNVKTVSVNVNVSSLRGGVQKHRLTTACWQLPEA